MCTRFITDNIDVMDFRLNGLMKTSTLSTVKIKTTYIG